MTVVFSTSSPIASVALLDEHRRILAQGEQEAHYKASGTLLFLLENCLRASGKSLTDTRLFVADVGPGSFTGVKVGVTMAKTMAFAHKVQVAGVTAFDLIDQDSAVAIPSRRGEWFLRMPGSEPVVTPALPDGVVDYRHDKSFPLAQNAAGLVQLFIPIRPALLVPLYVAEPSLSKPRDSKLLGGPRA